jgi:hypothetical protein
MIWLAMRDSVAVEPAVSRLAGALARRVETMATTSVMHIDATGRANTPRRVETMATMKRKRKRAIERNVYGRVRKRVGPQNK